MAAHNLSAVLKEHGNAVKLLRNSKIGMYVYPVVAPEFSNWRNEQVAWRKSAVLFDQTHHMDELIVEGPDSAAFLEHVGINSFANFDLNRAKHFVPVTPAGHVIGDMIIFREREDKFVLVGRAPTANWVRFQQAVGKWKVRLTHDPRSDSRPDGRAIYRTHYRFQIRTFWIGVLYIVVGSILLFVLVGFLVFAWLFIWSLVRNIKGLLLLNENRPIRDPGSWLFG